jgi:shikimate kinase
MGCGKSTLGRKLAARTGFDFIDLDKTIEGKVGCTIADYFREYGEQGFRELERDSLQKTIFPDCAIIATGGGAPCFFDNMDWMNRNGQTVYINLTPQTLADRLEHGKAERPLISRFSQEKLVEFITEKLQEREAFYKEAQHELNGVGLNAEKLAEVLGIS